MTYHDVLSFKVKHLREGAPDVSEGGHKTSRTLPQPRSRSQTVVGQCTPMAVFLFLLGLRGAQGSATSK